MNINKKALLEWLEQQPPQYKIIPTIQSGRFDSPSDDRLRETLVRVKEELHWGDAENAIDRVEKIIDGDLSTTEPTGTDRSTAIRLGASEGGNGREKPGGAAESARECG